MSIIWFIAVGLLVGSAACILTAKTDLGKLGNIVTCIIGSLTGFFFIDSLNLSSPIGVFGNIIVAITSSVFFLIVMRKISSSF